MEYEVGSKIVLEVVEDKNLSCEGCYFENFSSCGYIKCESRNRKDGKHVIFKEIK